MIYHIWLQASMQSFNESHLKYKLIE
jgi:hypothetical protein